MDLNESSVYKNTCAKLIEVNVTEWCTGMACSNYIDYILQDVKEKYFSIHYSALLRALIGYHYGGWIMEPSVLIKETFKPKGEMFFYYDDMAKTAVPTMHFAYFQKNSSFCGQYIRDFP